MIISADYKSVEKFGNVFRLQRLKAAYALAKSKEKLPWKHSNFTPWVCGKCARGICLLEPKRADRSPRRPWPHGITLKTAVPGTTVPYCHDREHSKYMPVFVKRYGVDATARLDDHQTAARRLNQVRGSSEKWWKSKTLFIPGSITAKPVRMSPYWGFFYLRSYRLAVKSLPKKASLKICF